AGRLRERYLGADRHVAASRRAARTAASEQASESTSSASEERFEDVGHRAERVEVGGVASATQALVPVAVIGRAAIGVSHHLVCLSGLLELLLGLRVVAVDVRVQLTGELAERLLDLGVGSVPGQAQDLVVVTRHL